MSDLAKRLTDLWALPDSDRDKGVKLLCKIYGNILKNPSDPKFRDLNFSKIRKKLDTCRPAFYLLFTAGFVQSVDGQRLQWQNNTITIKQLQQASIGLQAQINGEVVVVNDEFSMVVDPTETSIIKDRTMNLHRKKKEKEAEAKQLQNDLKKIEKMKTETETSQIETENNMVKNKGDNGMEVDDEEMKKAMAMSMEEDNENNDGDGDGDKSVDVAMTDNKNKKDDVESQLKDAGLGADELELIQQIKAAKGITVTLNASDLAGLSKEEKIAKFRSVQNEYRDERRKNIVKLKQDKERRRREGIKKAQEADRKRKEYELRMLSSRKKREKAEADKRKKAIKEKIAADKKRRLAQKEKDRKKKEAEKAAKLKAQQQQDQ